MVPIFHLIRYWVCLQSRYHTKLEMQNKNAYYIQQVFQKIKHGPWGGCIPTNAKELHKFDGIGEKFPFLVMHYIYGKVQVSMGYLGFLKHIQSPCFLFHVFVRAFPVMSM